MIGAAALLWGDASPAVGQMGAQVFPSPTRIESTAGAVFRRGPLRLSRATRVVVTSPQLHDIAIGLEERYWTALDHSPERVTGVEGITDRPGDIVLSLDPSLVPEGYELSITDRVHVRGGSPVGVAWGLSSLLQMILSLQDQGQVSVPRVTITDFPQSPFRGLQVDVASRTFSDSDLRELVLLCHAFKLRFLVLEFGNDEAFLLPWRGREGLQSWRGYSEERIAALREFARQNGVTLVPGLPSPFAARSLISGDAEVFQGPPGAGPGTIHLGKEQVYEELENLVRETRRFFPESPYIFVGDAPVDLAAFVDNPEVAEFSDQHDIDSVDGLVPYFFNRLGRYAEVEGASLLVDEAVFQTAWSFSQDEQTARPRLGDEAGGETLVVLGNGDSPRSRWTFGRRVENPAAVASWNPTEEEKALSQWRGGTGRVAEGPVGGRLRLDDLYPFLAVPRLHQWLPGFAQALWSGPAGQGAVFETDGTGSGGDGMSSDPKQPDTQSNPASQLALSLTRPARLLTEGFGADHGGFQDVNAANRFSGAALLAAEAMNERDRVLLSTNGGLPSDDDEFREPLSLSRDMALRFAVTDPSGRLRGVPWTMFVERETFSVGTEGQVFVTAGEGGVTLVAYLDSVLVDVRPANGVADIALSFDDQELQAEDGRVRVNQTGVLSIVPLNQGDSIPVTSRSVRFWDLRVRRHLGQGAAVEELGVGRAESTWGSPEFVVDGTVDPRRFWEASAGGAATLVVDLGAPQAVDAIAVATEAPGGFSPGWSVEGAETKGVWVTLAEGAHSSSRSGPGPDLHLLEEPQLLRWVRFRFQGNPLGHRLRLIELSIRELHGSGDLPLD